MFSELHNIFDAFTKRERRAWLGAIVGFLLSAFLGSINAFYSQTTVAPVAGGSYEEGIVGQPSFLNPLIAQSDADRSVNELLYRNLLALSEQHKENEGHTVWSFTLHPDLKWSDGSPLTANDVVFTVEAIQDSDTRSPLFATWQGVTVERVSEREVRFTLKTPYAFFLDNIQDLKIAPQHIFGTIPTENIRLSDYNLAPVGSGPYAFDHFVKRKDGFIESYMLKANPHYGADPPLIKEFVVSFFPSYDEATAAFNRKEIGALGGLEPGHLEDLKIVHEISAFDMPRYYALFLNQNSNAALKEKAVRVALREATNNAGIIQAVFSGHAASAMGPIHPSMKGYDASVYAQDSFSLDAARARLESAGWKAGEDGIRGKTIGKETMKLSFTAIVPDIPFLKKTVEYLVRDWKSIGVELKPLLMNPEDIVRDPIKTRNYEMILFGNILHNNPDVFSFWHSSERFAPGLNLALYDSRAVDTVLENIRKDFDATSTTKDVAELEKTIHDDVPAIFLYSPQYLYAHPKSLGGFEERFIVTPSDRFADVAHWHLKTARIFR